LNLPPGMNALNAPSVLNSSTTLTWSGRPSFGRAGRVLRLLGHGQTSTGEARSGATRTQQRATMLTIVFIWYGLRCRGSQARSGAQCDCCAKPKLRRRWASPGFPPSRRIPD
jgi:hypothetical protein